MIHAFANEIRRIVRVASATYRNAERQEIIGDGSVGQHRCYYEISLLGNLLGEITFTRNKFFFRTRARTTRDVALRARLSSTQRIIV